MALGLFTSLPNKTICYQVSILWQKTIFAHIVYDYTVNICTYYEHTILFSISPLTFLLSFLLYCLFFTIIIVYCYNELSFGCCDAHISLELIKELLLRILISALDAWVQDELEKQTRLAEKQNWLKKERQKNPTKNRKQTKKSNQDKTEENKRQKEKVWLFTKTPAAKTPSRPTINQNFCAGTLKSLLNIMIPASLTFLLSLVFSHCRAFKTSAF